MLPAPALPASAPSAPWHRHPTLTALHPSLQITADCWALLAAPDGSSRKEHYLPKGEREPDTAYRKRLDAARPSGFFRDALRTYAGMLSRGSWISLFAMLMIFIGPLISQSMPMDQHASTSMPMSMDMSMDMPGMDHSGHDAKPSAEHCPPQSSHHVLWEKCGYCSLLFSCPALPGSQVLALFDTPLVHTFLSLSPRQGHARQTVFPGARTRAPPIVT